MAIVVFYLYHGDTRWGSLLRQCAGVIGPHHGPEIDSASNRNEYQEYFPGVKAADA